MADLKVFQRGADGRDVELRGSTVARERELHRRVEGALEPMLGVRFLASEYSTGPWHQGRIDTLGLGEDGVPVVIERGRDAGVIAQAGSYLVWLLAHRHEFEALVRRRLGADVAEAVDWRRPRVICVAGEFSRHACCRFPLPAGSPRGPGALPRLRAGPADTAVGRDRSELLRLRCLVGDDRSG
ncbi:hypothetical protein [Kitasatospora sp. NPDC059599]|uniref:hypothetical protein n=1 Tax=Kitasatospora sp. NPDC059599 TaxID=3346880 RepID=UPI00367DFC5D